MMGEKTCFCYRRISVLGYELRAGTLVVADSSSQCPHHLVA